jgi:hypothetical protein
MARRQHLRGVKVCAHCGAGYDGFKAMESRGRYCSPGCLAAARALRHVAVDTTPGPDGSIALAQ